MKHRSAENRLIMKKMSRIRNDVHKETFKRIKSKRLAKCKQTVKFKPITYENSNKNHIQEPETKENKTKIRPIKPHTRKQKIPNITKFNLS
jgi:hypothetical protein